jgi:hypothetical protein
MNSPLIATTKNEHYIVCLPTYGRPYIAAVVKESTRLKSLQKAVGGYIEKVDRKSFIIHPMFLENPKWKIAERLLQDSNAKVYVNEEGAFKCVPNMATILSYRSPSGCPHYFGDIAIHLTKKGLENVCDPMTLQVTPENDPELNAE